MIIIIILILITININVDNDNNDNIIATETRKIKRNKINIRRLKEMTNDCDINMKKASSHRRRK